MAAALGQSMAGTAPLRVGILGAARIAPSAMIAPAAGRTDVIVTHVAARDEGRARAFAEAHGIAAERDYAALIARDDIDLIYVALPPSHHAKWSIRALEAGKAVLCEKPFATTSAEAIAMTEVARRCGRPLIEAFHYRFHPVMLKAIEIVRSGALGPIREAQAVFRGQVPLADSLWRGDLGSGALTDIGCYPIHALRTLFGEPEIASAEIDTANGAISRADARMRFAGGIAGIVNCSMQLQEGERHHQMWLRVTGERGMMDISNFIVPQLFGCTFRTLIEGVEQEIDTDLPRTTYEAQLDHVVAVMSGREQPLTGGDDAVANVRTIEAIRIAGGLGLWEGGI